MSEPTDHDRLVQRDNRKHTATCLEVLRIAASAISVAAHESSSDAPPLLLGGLDAKIEELRAKIPNQADNFYMLKALNWALMDMVERGSEALTARAREIVARVGLVDDSDPENPVLHGRTKVPRN